MPNPTLPNPVSLTTAVRRADWVIATVHACNHPFAETAPQELATKMALLAKDPFSFYRGTNPLFFQDMGALPPSRYTSARTALTWLAGDAHLDNFEAARDAAGTVVFKVSDFDEGYRGHYVWDLRRLVTSVVLTGREQKLAEKAMAEAVEAVVDAYVEAIRDFKNNEDERDFRLVKSGTRGVVEDIIAAAESKKRTDLLDKYTEIHQGRRRFQNLPTLLRVDHKIRQAIERAMEEYIESISLSKRHPSAFYAIKDICQKMGSGAGSLGRLRYYVLVEGRNDSQEEDVILEMKQAVPSAVAQIVPGQLAASVYDQHEGKRVAMTAKALQRKADVLIGHTTVNRVPYYVHEKAPHQKDFDHTLLESERKLTTAAPYFGQALAVAHALADQDLEAGGFERSIDQAIAEAVTSKSGLKAEMIEFALAYAEQVVLDWQVFVEAYEQGVALY